MISRLQVDIVRLVGTGGAILDAKLPTVSPTFKRRISPSAGAIVVLSVERYGSLDYQISRVYRRISTQRGAAGHAYPGQQSVAAS
jgi:hypothetical protein